MTNTTEIIFNKVKELGEIILHSEWLMLKKRLEKTAVFILHKSENWSNWKTAMVPLYDRTNTKNRDQKQVGFIWKYILNDGNLPELCGIYEWRAIRQDQPNRVVYVGSTCTRCGHYEPLQSRILRYCSHGNHKADLINDALTKGYTLEVRYKQAKSRQ